MHDCGQRQRVRRRHGVDQGARAARGALLGHGEPLHLEPHTTARGRLRDGAPLRRAVQPLDERRRGARRRYRSGAAARRMLGASARGPPLVPGARRRAARYEQRAAQGAGRQVPVPGLERRPTGAATAGRRRGPRRAQHQPDGPGRRRRASPPGRRAGRCPVRQHARQCARDRAPRRGAGARARRSRQAQARPVAQAGRLRHGRAQDNKIPRWRRAGLDLTK